MNNRLVRAEEVAVRLGIRPSTVKSWAREGLIPCVRPTQRVIRFDLAAVEAALHAEEAQQRRGSTEDHEHA